MFFRFRFVLWAIVLPCVFVSCHKDNEEPFDVLVDFQNVDIPDGKYQNDAGDAGFFEEGIAKFQNTQSWGYRYGFVYSQMHDVKNFDYATNEYSVYVPDDPKENKFMVGYVSFWDAPTIEITFSKPVKDLSFDVANSTLAALAMKGEDPNQFARKFEEGDFFDLIVQLYDADDRPLFLDDAGEARPAKIPLAQGAQILAQWMNISIAGGAVSKIEFSLDSSDINTDLLNLYPPELCINTPTYFCIDNIKARTVK